MRPSAEVACEKPTSTRHPTQSGAGKLHLTGGNRPGCWAMSWTSTKPTTRDHSAENKAQHKHQTGLSTRGKASTFRRRVSSLPWTCGREERRTYPPAPGWGFPPLAVALRAPSATGRGWEVSHPGEGSASSQVGERPKPSHFSPQTLPLIFRS